MQLTIQIVPRAHETKLERQVDGTWKAWVVAPPVDGAVNDALIGLIADYFDVPKSSVRIRRGAGSRIKYVEVNQ